MGRLAYVLGFLMHLYCLRATASSLPLIVNTWAFTDATEAGWVALTANSTSTPHLDAVVEVRKRSRSAFTPF